jgi:hypothetical protein
LHPETKGRYLDLKSICRPVEYHRPSLTRNTSSYLTQRKIKDRFITPVDCGRLAQLWQATDARQFLTSFVCKTHRSASARIFFVLLKIRPVPAKLEVPLDVLRSLQVTQRCWPAGTGVRKSINCPEGPKPYRSFHFFLFWGGGRNGFEDD